MSLVGLLLASVTFGQVLSEALCGVISAGCQPDSGPHSAPGVHRCLLIDCFGLLGKDSVMLELSQLTGLDVHVRFTSPNLSGKLRVRIKYGKRHGPVLMCQDPLIGKQDIHMPV